WRDRNGFFDPNASAQQICLVQFAIDSHRQAQTARTAGQFIFRSATTAAAHHFDPFRWFKRSYQDRMWNVFDVCDDIELVVHAVNEIDVSGATDSIHRFRALCAPAMPGM